jgi:hypothetical protein
MRCLTRRLKKPSGFGRPAAYRISRPANLLRLPPAVVPAFVARREVEGLETGGPGGPGQGSGLAGGQVIALAGLIEVGVQERGLAEEEIGAVRQPDDAGRIGGREQHVDHIGDLLPRGHDEEVVAQGVQRAPVARRDLDGEVVVGAAPHGRLEPAQPRARAEPARLEGVRTTFVVRSTA